MPTKTKDNPKQDMEDRADARSLAAIRKMTKADLKPIPAWKVAKELGYDDLAKKLRH